MSKELKRYKARIFGELYPIVSDEDELFVASVISRVDNLMKEIAEQNNFADAKKIAVLAALKSSQELLELQEALLQETKQSSKIMTILDLENIRL